MLYIWIAISAYLLNAVNAIIDKFLLSEKRISDPKVYAFSIGTLNALVVVFIPFGFSVPPMAKILSAFLAGALFTYALLAFFQALKTSEASRIVPIQGGLVPFFTLGLAAVFVHEKLSATTIFAVILLIIGTVLISLEKKAGGTRLESVLYAILAAFLFALSFTLTKSAFLDLGFINGLIWTRFGTVAGALILLTGKRSRQSILSGLKSSNKQAQAKLFVIGQVVGAVGGTAQNYAIALGSVTVVNALQGTQFVFLLLMTGFLSFRFPNVVSERFTRGILLQKALAIILISFSIVLLSMQK